MNRVDVYPFIEAEKLNSHIDQDGHTTAPGSASLTTRQGNVKRACELLEVSRSAYYQHRAVQAAGGSARHRADAELTEKIRTIHAGSGGTYGSPRVHADLTDDGVRVGRKRVARLMRGDGLAVVASEVKDLASETSRATEDITGKISAIQTTTAQATAAIARITAVIDQINENQTTIAAAVEEQTATTSEISRNVAEVSAGSGHIAGTIGDIAESAADTSKGAGATRQSAQELAALASRVQVLVQQFTY